jgi:type I restriction enzyme M protein
MLTGEIRNKVDGLWTAFWTGGIANPLTVIEQISYLRIYPKTMNNACTILSNQVLSHKRRVSNARKIQWSY